MKRYIIFTVLLAVFLYNAFAQTAAPEITQIVVNETGNVTLTWTPNTSVTDFDHSEVWYQQSYVQGFHKIPNSGNPDYTAYYYVHTDARANNRETDFYVVNYNSNLETFISDTVSAIYLTACFSPDEIQLNWNKIHPSWTGDDFYIYRKAGLGSTWQFLDSTSDTSYQDILVPGYEEYSYKVYYKDASDATASVSNATNPISYSDHQPVTPLITSIAIEPTGYTAIEWEKSPSTNVTTYIIYVKKTTGNWEELGKTGSPDQLFWFDQQTTLYDCEQLRAYAIAAIDNCDETGTNYPDSSKNILILHTPEYKTGDNKIKLLWEPYESMSVTRYEIYTSNDNGNTFVKYAELPATETEYSFINLEIGRYCFKVRAIHEREIGEKPQIITSCHYCVDVYIPQGPEITQIVVDETGGVTLTWIPNTFVTDFDHSEVWYQQSYFPGYNKIPDSENPDYAASHYEHTDARANNRQTDYYVLNYNSALEVLSSDTVSAIYLTACFSSEKIQLKWNQIHPSWTGHAFHIYRKAGVDSDWEFIDSTYNISYQDIPEPGYKDYSYKVYYKDASSATASVSNATDPISYSNHQPITPSITSITIEPDGTTAIEWEKSPSTNVVDYIIYIEKSTGGWEELGRTGSPDEFNWIDRQTTLYDCEQLRTYAIAAIDNCGETGTNYPDSCKNTFVLYNPNYEICDSEIKLLWEPYENMTVTRYEIYISDDNGDTFVKHTELPATETEYSYTDLKTGHYCFKISAIHERGEEEKPQIITSCYYCIDVYVPQEPGASFFHYVSVKDNTIRIRFEVDNTTAVSQKYQIERSETGLDGSYDIITTLESTGSDIISFVDNDPVLNTQNTSYHYLLHALDSCGKAFPAEKPAQSILLTATEDENHHANLEWNHYDGFLTELDYYIIHRYINDELDNTFSATIRSNFFTDINMRIANQALTFAYRITAISNPYNNDYSKIDTAFSNIAPLKRLDSDVWFPNAFAPMGGNKIFRPIYSGIEVETYEFTIFDRYGAAIYQTTEPGGGWDGKINGSVAASGGYGYMLKIKLKNGDRIERRGSMLLVL
ncbi:MAG: gliding motility-associated C-terminal domain-containing protein [Bacteroidales bacterium]|nr:gliding motility-associated C-terminal domain-containing protein [Bacteroidales bacterium]